MLLGTDISSPKDGNMRVIKRNYFGQFIKKKEEENILWL